MMNTVTTFIQRMWVGLNILTLILTLPYVWATKGFQNYTEALTMVLTVACALYFSVRVRNLRASSK
jgi:hypothetical protein